MKKKSRKNYCLPKEPNNNIKSKEYTINELIELGKKYNKIELAPPLFDKKISNTKEQDS